MGSLERANDRLGSAPTPEVSRRCWSVCSLGNSYSYPDLHVQYPTQTVVGICGLEICTLLMHQHTSRIRWNQGSISGPHLDKIVREHDNTDKNYQLHELSTWIAPCSANNQLCTWTTTRLLSNLELINEPGLRVLDRHDACWKASLH